jgi:hypothetical protein
MSATSRTLAVYFVKSLPAAQYTVITLQGIVACKVHGMPAGNSFAMPPCSLLLTLLRLVGSAGQAWLCA